MPCEDFYCCSFLKAEDNTCHVYPQRPFECALYPFLLVRHASSLALGLDHHCPYIARCGKDAFKQYTLSLIEELRQRIDHDIPRTLAHEYTSDQIEIITSL